MSRFCVVLTAFFGLVSLPVWAQPTGPTAKPTPLPAEAPLPETPTDGPVDPYAPTKAEEKKPAKPAKPSSKASPKPEPKPDIEGPLDPYQDGVPGKAPTPPKPSKPPAAEEPLSPYPTTPSKAPAPAGPGRFAPTDLISDQVAQALHARAVSLYGNGDYAAAATLLSEALEIAPNAATAQQSQALLVECQKHLRGPTQNQPPPVAPSEPLQDPYSNAQTPVTPAPPPAEVAWHVGTMGVGAGLGLSLGLALVGPYEDDDNGGESVSDGSILLGAVVGGLGAAGAYFADKNLAWSEAERDFISSATVVGGAYGGLFADVASGFETENNTPFRGAAIGGVLGAGAAVLMVRGPLGQGRLKKTDVGHFNLFVAHGMAAGINLAALMDPPHGEAYSLNAMIGGAAGFAGGFLLRSSLELSSKRQLWLGMGSAFGGGVPWLLAIGDDPALSLQAAGGLSLLGMGGGLVAGWFLGKHFEGVAAAPINPAIAASLLIRTEHGQWQAGLPMVQVLPQPTGQLAVTTSIVAGEF